MPDHVRERLLGDAVRRRLDRGGQGRGVAGELDGELEPGPAGQLVAELGQGAEETEVVERGRTQPFDDPAHLGHGSAQPELKGVEPVLHRLARSEPVGHRVDLQAEPGEGGAKAVVQVAADPTPLLLTGEDQRLARVPQLLDQTDRVHGAADLVGHVDQE